MAEDENELVVTGGAKVTSNDNINTNKIKVIKSEKGVKINCNTAGMYIGLANPYTDNDDMTYMSSIFENVPKKAFY